MVMDVMMKPDAFLCWQVTRTSPIEETWVLTRRNLLPVIRSTRGHRQNRRRRPRRSLASSQRRARKKSSESERRLMRLPNRPGSSCSSQDCDSTEVAAPDNKVEVTAEACPYSSTRPSWADACGRGTCRHRSGLRVFMLTAE